MSHLNKVLILFVLVAFTLPSLSLAEADSSGDLFGIGQGYFHPEVKVSTKYSDNYKSAATNEESDWQTTISPGFWVSIPSSRAKAFNIVSSNAAPGGKGVSRFQDADFKGFQSSLMYNADIVRSHDHKEEDNTKHRVQGLLQYAFAGGLTLEASDVYIKSTEEYSETTTADLEKYNSNLANLIAFYEYSPKLKFRVGYSNFDLEYTSGLNNGFKERTDDQISAYVIYRILPKTELFVQYDFIDQDYKQNILADSDEQHIFAGVKFDTNARISGHAKIGYGDIDSDLAANGDFDDLIGDASLKYSFGGASTIALNAKQIVNVSSDQVYQNILHSEVGLTLSHKLTQKLGVSASVTLKEDEYRVDSRTSGREDEDVVASLKGTYQLLDWLSVGATYTYTDRDSNIAANSYDSNVVMFNVSATF